MKKIINIFLGLAIVLGLTGQSWAQSLRLVNNNPVLRGAPSAALINNAVGDVRVTNITSRTLVVKVSRTILSEVNGSTNNMCWGVNCYTPTTSITPSGDSIEPNGTNTTFVADYNPNNTEGTSRIKYCFFVNGSATDSVCTIMTFSTVTSAKAKANLLQMVASPNPCSDVLNLTFVAQDEAARLDMFNLLGQKVISQNIAAGTTGTSLRTADLPAGQYFVRFMIGNKSIATTRVSVK